MNVAITGHQNLGSTATRDWIATTLEDVVKDLTITKGYTCLAIGADQLFAEILYRKSVPFVAVLACSKIEASFTSEEGKKTFRQLLAQASNSITLSYEDPSEEAYFEAGKTVVEQSDLLIAVWNGHSARGLGGTADVVNYARKNKKKVIHINLESRQVIQIGNEQQAERKESVDR